MQYQYNHLACGGTFDRLHAGHKAFLIFAFSKASEVSIGIATDKFVKKSGKKNVTSFIERRKRLEDFLIKNELARRANVIELDDVYGTTLEDKSLDGIVVTTDTKNGAIAINTKRKELGLGNLEILETDLICSEDGQIISSTRVRAGNINRKGVVYKLPRAKSPRYSLSSLQERAEFLISEVCNRLGIHPWTKSPRYSASDYKIPGADYDFEITQELRRKLGEPLGHLYEKLTLKLTAKIKSQKGLLITVGDEVTRTFLAAGIEPDLIVVDLVINRKKAFNSLLEIVNDPTRKTVKVKNRRGSISSSLITTVSDYLSNCDGKAAIEVIGEEDLAVLPIVLLAPLSTRVFYGLREKGFVEIKVGEKNKDEFANFLSDFCKIKPST